VHGVPGVGANSDTSTYSTWGYIKIGDRLTPHPSLQNSWTATTAPQTLHSSNALAYPFDASGLIPFNPDAVFFLESSAPGISVTNSTNSSSYSIQKTSGGNAWDEHAYSTTHHGAGVPVTLTFTAQENNTYKMMGLNSDPTANTSYNTIDFAWYPLVDGTVQIYENGNKIGTSYGNYTTSTLFSITYDNYYVTYKMDGVTKRTVAKGANWGFYVDSSIYTVGGGFDNIRFYTGNVDALYEEVYTAFAMPATEAYIENGECVKTSPLEWATNNGYMGLIIWGTDLHGGGKRVINELSPKGKKISAIPYFFDAQGSPLHLLEIITNILHQGGDTTLTLCQELGTLSNAIQKISHNELVEGEFQDHARFMWGWGMGLQNKTSHDDILPNQSGRQVGTRLSALTISDLRFYMRAGKVEKEGYVNSYRPHVSIGTHAYNISGRFTDQVFGLGSGQSGMELEHAAEFNGNWTTQHSDAFTANQNLGSQNLGFYLAGDGEVSGSPHGDNWQINKEMTSTLNADKTYEIWVKPLSTGRQSLFYGSGTIQHIEIYPNTNNFRTEATLQNGKAFGGSKNQATVLTENYEGRGASSGFEVGQWNCLTITFNTNQANGDGKVCWYNNGYLIHVGNMWNQTYGNEEYFAFSHIGRATGSSAYLYAKSFHGYFDEFKIYDRVLEDDEITNNVRSSRHFKPKYHTL